MALRVLLADESSTIKKVMLLALQDFAVEVKAVHVGVDVLEVARTFKPDLIFVDVLLQKRNGYEVCADLKADATTRHTPTILMWSSFMELDQEALAKAQPNDKIEKPFDVETLRKMVLALVPETRSQRLAHFLEFPEVSQKTAANVSAGTSSTIPMPPPTPNSKASIPLPPPTSQTKTGVPLPPPVSQSRTSIPLPPPSAPKPEETKRAWNMDSFDDINEFEGTDLGSVENSDQGEEDFAPVNLSRSAPTGDPEELSLEPSNEPADEAWAHRDLSRFKIELPPVSVESEGLDLKIEMGEDEFTASGFLYKPERNASASTLELEPSDEEVEDRTQPVLEVPDETAQIGLALEREEIPEPLEPMSMRESYRDPMRERDVPQLSADRIEEIIRAQSREIIEDVVRRIVPDIATELIREELERLLEESSVRETRRREPRP
ncbi:MAG: response regulator [Bdellovibrionota bacterium]